MTRCRSRKGLASLFLVRCVSSPATTPISAAIATTARETTAAAAVESSSAAEASSSATSTHAGDVGSLRCDLDVAAFEDAFVEDECLGD